MNTSATFAHGSLNGDDEACGREALSKAPRGKCTCEWCATALLRRRGHDMVRPDYGRHSSHRRAAAASNSGGHSSPLPARDAINTGLGGAALKKTTHARPTARHPGARTRPQATKSKARHGSTKDQRAHKRRQHVTPGTGGEQQKGRPFG